MALKSYGDWDGVPENFEQEVAATLDNRWNQPEMLAEFMSLVEAADSLEKQRSPSRPITLDEAMKLKAFCDAYLGNRAKREVQKAIRQRQPSEKSPLDTESQPMIEGVRLSAVVLSHESHSNHSSCDVVFTV
jgi:hypothetical protein